jgi:hypothetical protein
METIVKQTTKEDQKIALASISQFAETSQGVENANRFVEIKISSEKSPVKIKISKKALSLLGTILSNMAEGKSIVLVTSDATLTTQKAAGFLKI